MTNHDDLAERVPLLAVGALDEDERAELLKHVSGCRTCTALLDDYQAVAAELLRSVPIAPWAPNLETRLRARRLALRATPPAPAPRRSALPMLPRSRRVLAGAAVVLLLLLGFSAVLWWNAQNSQVAVAPNGDTAELTQLLQMPGTVALPINGTPNAPQAVGQVILNPNNARAYLIVNNLAPLTGDQTYQVWLTAPGNQRDNAGTFTVDQKGHATARIWASKPWNNYLEIGVTLEPGKGSQWPTTPRLIGGPLH